MNKEYNGVPVVTKIPKGWRIREGALAQPNGTVLITNGKSLFERDRNGKRTYKQAFLIIDKELYKETCERKAKKKGRC